MYEHMFIHMYKHYNTQTNITQLPRKLSQINIK